MNNFIANSYLVLELKPGASLEEIKSAYRDLVKVWHPAQRQKELRRRDGEVSELW
jgi:curved DNA-binding protein CbpA